MKEVTVKVMMPEGDQCLEWKPFFVCPLSNKLGWCELLDGNTPEHNKLPNCPAKSK